MPSDRVPVRDHVPVRARCHLPTCPFATACPFATTASTTTFLRRQVPSRKTTSCSSLVKGAVGISSISTPSCARTSRGSSFGRSPRPSRAVTAGTLSAPRQNCHACARWRPVLGTAPRPAPAPSRPRPRLRRPVALHHGAASAALWIIHALVPSPGNFLAGKHCLNRHVRGEIGHAFRNITSLLGGASQPALRRCESGTSLCGSLGS